MRLFPIFALAVLSGCAIQQSVDAGLAKENILGMTHEEVWACMGPPHASAAFASAEVWSYQSGGSSQSVSTGGAYGQSSTNGSGTYGGGAWQGQSDTDAYALNLGNTNSFGYSCQVNITFTGDRVAKVSYMGRTGKLLTPDSECYFATKECLPE